MIVEEKDRTRRGSKQKRRSDMAPKNRKKKEKAHGKSKLYASISILYSNEETIA